jgi:hypothetical protein
LSRKFGECGVWNDSGSVRPFQDVDNKWRAVLTEIRNGTEVTQEDCGKKRSRFLE